MDDLVNTESMPPFEIEKKYQENPALALAEMKEFVIGYMRDFQIRLFKNNEKDTEEIKQRLTDIENKLDNHNVKIESIQNETQINQNKIDKINDLVLFSKKTTDQIMSIDIKLNSLQKEFSNACYKYDKIYLDNLNVPGTIGDYCKYKNIREYIETSITQVQNLLSYKEKNTSEFKIYKEKFENLITGLSSQLENAERSMKNFTTKMLQDTEVNFKREYENMGIKIGDMRLENNKYAYQLQKNANELTAEKDKILSIKSEINKQLDDALDRCREMNKNTADNFESIKGEYHSIKSKFIELSEFIKDVRFRKNLGVEVTKTEIKKLTNKITSDSKKPTLTEHNYRANSQQHIENNFSKIKSSEAFNNNNMISNLDDNEKEQDDLNPNANYNSDDYHVESYVKEYIKGNSINMNHHNTQTHSNHVSLKQLYSNSKKGDESSKKNEKFKKKLINEEAIRSTRENIDCDNSNYNYNKNNSENFNQKISSEDYFSENKVFSGKVIKEQTESFKSVRENEKVNSENNAAYKTESTNALEKEENKLINKVIKNLDINIEDNNNNEAAEENYSTDSKLSPDAYRENNKKQNTKSKTDKKLPVILTNLQEERNTIEVINSENITDNNNKHKSALSLNTLIPNKVNQTNNNSNNVNKTSTKKFKDKFPLEKTNRNQSNNSGNQNKSWSLEKMEREELAKRAYINTEINTIVSKNANQNSNLNSSNNMSNKEFANILGEFNDNFFNFKKEFFKKISNTEQKINQIEYFSKKKFEELAGQIKNFLPINFNPYMKDFKEKIPESQISNAKINQFNVENLIINENLGAGQNFALKVIDTSNFRLPMNSNPVNKKNIKTVMLNKTNTNFPNLNNANSKSTRNASASNSRPILKETSRNFNNLNTTNFQPAINQVNNLDLRIDESDFVKDYSFVENITKITKSKEKMSSNHNANATTVVYKNPKIDTSNVPKNRFLDLNCVLTNKTKNNSKE